MRKLILVAVGLALIAIPVLAGEYLMNDTGQTVYGLTVTFSEPVTITGFGDVLMTVEPTGESTSFTFSGGELEAWGGQWLNWEPVSALLLDHKWFLSVEGLGTSLRPGAWQAFPSQVDWLTAVQVPAFQVPADLADSTFVTMIGWGSSWQRNPPTSHPCRRTLSV